MAGFRQDAHRGLGARLEDESFEHLEILKPVESHPGIAVHRAVGEPFNHEHRRHHRAAVQYVGFQARQSRNTHLALERKIQHRGSGRRLQVGPVAITIAPRVGAHRQGQHLNRLADGRADLPDEELRSSFRLDQAYPFAFKDLAQALRNHAPIPGPPVERDNPALRPSP